MKQEKEDASEEVVEVAPGIRRLQLPIDFTGLGHVNCYALEDARGVTLVDPGLPGPQSWAALQSRLATAEIPLARVHTVVVTHSHPDHFGSAGLLAEETGAEVVTFERFRTFFDVADLDESPLETADPATTDDPEAAGTRSPSGCPGRRPGAGRRWARRPSAWPRCGARSAEAGGLVQAAQAARSGSPTTSGSPWAGGSGSGCSRRATPTTTSASTTRSTACCWPATRCCPPSRRTSRGT